MSFTPSQSQEQQKNEKKVQMLESLRYSDMDDKSDTFSISTDGPEIQFLFDAEEDEAFTFETAPPVSFSKDRRKEMFAKYKQPDLESSNIVENDLMDEFDNIFRIKSQEQQADKQEQATNKEINEGEVKKDGEIKGGQIQQKQAQVILVTSEEKKSLPDEIEQKLIKKPYSTRVTQSQPLVFQEPAITAQKNPVKISFNYQPSSVVTPSNSSMSKSVASSNVVPSSSSKIMYKSVNPSNIITSSNEITTNRELSSSTVSVKSMNSSNNLVLSPSPQLRNQISIPQNLMVMMKKDSSTNWSDLSQSTVSMGGSRKLIEPATFVSYSADQNTQNSWIRQPLFQEEERVAKFLRKFHKINSIYPNFCHPSTNLEAQSYYIQVVAGTLEQSLLTVEKVAEQVFYLLKMPKKLPNELLRMDYFVKSGWERNKEVTLIDEIKPRNNSKSGPINEQKLFQALKNYKEVINYYKNYRSNDLQNAEGKKHYLKIRDKFWKLERNIRSISVDVYNAYLQIKYPRFFYDYLSGLRSPPPTVKDRRISDRHNALLATLKQNMQKGEPLSCSEVGLALKTKIERQLKLLHPF